MNVLRHLSLVLACAAVACAHAFAANDDLRVGLIGLDSSHAIAFTRLLNDSTHREHIPGARVVAAFKGGSPDIAASATRIDGFVAELQKDPGIAFYDSIEELLGHVDAVMILSVDGRAHLPQALPVLRARKPLFIDKPLAASLRDAIAILTEAERQQTPCFSASSLRYAPGYLALKDADLGDVRGAFAYGPATLEPHHPDLFWYGIHAVETLYTVMGPGCTSVARTHTADADVVTGTWSDGRIGTMRGTRGGPSAYGLTVFGTKKVVSPDPGRSYAPLVAEIVAFFRSGIAPVSPRETIEIFAFLTAAEESKRRGGASVSLAEVLAATQP